VLQEEETGLKTRGDIISGNTSKQKLVSKAVPWREKTFLFKVRRGKEKGSILHGMVGGLKLSGEGETHG